MKLNRKNKLLVFGFIAALFICYYFSISKTFEYYNLFQKQNLIVNQSNNSPNYYYQLLQKDKQLDNLLKELSIETSLYQNELLKHLSEKSSEQNLKILEFNEPHLISNGNTTTISYRFTLQGSFNGVLTLLNSIENRKILGTIIHTNTSKTLNYKTNQYFLNTEVIIQKSETKTL